MPELVVFSAFRSHILLPHDVVGSIIDSKPTWDGMSVNEEGMFFRGSEPVMRVRRRDDHVTVEAFSEVWLQEPGLVVKIAGDGTWRGFGPKGKWTSDLYALRQKDAHLATLHFSRVKTNPNYTVGVEYRFRKPSGSGFERWRFRSDGGFMKLLDKPAEPVPWQDCEIFGEGYELVGTAAGYEVLRRWELAGKPPNIGQMYFLGWTGGSGCVTDKNGRTYLGEERWRHRYLWQPRSWRRLRAGQSITQTLVRQ